jgi:hypothetical protein
MDGVKVTRRKITDYRPDPRNANQGTERGQYMLDKSVEQVGAARSIVAAADDTIPAGNKSLQAFVDAGLEDVIEIETDGTTPVVVKRTDWASVDSEQARKYAYFDNRTNEVGLTWDVQQVLTDIESGMDLDAMFFDWELDQILGKVAQGGFDPSAEWEGMPEYESEDGRPAYAIKVNFRSLEDLQDFARLIEQKLTEQTRSIWYPIKPSEETKNIAWISDES